MAQHLFPQGASGSKVYNVVVDGIEGGKLKEMADAVRQHRKKKSNKPKSSSARSNNREGAPVATKRRRTSKTVKKQVQLQSIDDWQASLAGFKVPDVQEFDSLRDWLPTPMLSGAPGNAVSTDQLQQLHEQARTGQAQAAGAGQLGICRHPFH